MTSDAGDPGRTSRARRPGHTILLAFAVLLFFGGGTAVAVGIAGQDADPPAPVASQPSPQAAGPPTTAGSPGSPAGADRPTQAPDSSVPAETAETAETAENAEPAAAAPVALPTRISIPAIEVESELITLGLNPDGTLAVPQPGPDYDKAAWFDGSPRPGDVGPAVIEGHVDSAKNGPSVFYELGALVAGDRIDVTREDGTTASFVVDEVRVVPKDDFPTLEVYGNTEGPELRLITCGGPFDSTAGSYEDNVVVFASLAG